MARQEALHNRLGWALSYVGPVRLGRAVLMACGLFLSLVFASLGPADLFEAPFLLGLTLFAAATGLTFTRRLTRLQPWVLVLVPLLDIAAICLFDLIPNADVIDALIAVPAMWLGLTLGARGIALACCSVALLTVTPGLLTHGAPLEGWGSAMSITLLTALAAGGMTVSSAVWTKQLRRLEHQSQVLQAAVEVKGDFIALVSHELRSPLTSIMGYLEMIDDMADPLPEEAHLYLAAVSRNADRLLLLVTDLLAASEVENTPMRLDLETVDVGVLAHLSLDDMNQRALEAGLSMTADIPHGITAIADPSRILQVLDNVLSNAVKFTPPGGHITVTLRERANGIDLVITDTGVGIDAESLPSLATKFFRTPQTTRNAVPGVGLGLMITKAIIKAHHGDLTFTSQDHEGTSVRVHLPRTPLGVATSESPRPEAPVAAA